MVMIALSLILKHIKRKKALAVNPEETEKAADEPETIPEFPDVPDVEDEEDGFEAIDEEISALEEKAAEEMKAARDVGELPVIPEDTFYEEDS